jgi:hypothetical protein
MAGTEELKPEAEPGELKSNAARTGNRPPTEDENELQKKNAALKISRWEQAATVKITGSKAKRKPHSTGAQDREPVAAKSVGGSERIWPSGGTRSKPKITEPQNSARRETVSRARPAAEHRCGENRNSRAAKTLYRKKNLQLHKTNLRLAAMIRRGKRILAAIETRSQH